MGNDPVVTMEFVAEGAAVVTMTNPALQNQGSWAAMVELAAALRAAREGGSRVTVLASGLDDVWFGHAWLPDICAVFEGTEQSGEGRGWFDTLAECNRRDVVTIAAINGDTFGGGCEVGWACDLRVAEPGVHFCQPEVALGVGTGLGGTSRLRHLIGRTVTAEMVLDGRMQSADRIHQLGGINRMAAPGMAREDAVAWAVDLASHPPHALAAMKQMLTESDDLIHMVDGVNNDQRIFGEVSGHPEAIARMRQVQARYDAGETMKAVFGER